jgi:hypothetical protein
MKVLGDIIAEKEATLAGGKNDERPVNQDPRD